MCVKEFRNYIKSIGFKFFTDWSYCYKEFKINLYTDCYHFHDGSGWCFYKYNDLSTIENYFKNELRSIKLKKILG